MKAPTLSKIRAMVARSSNIDVDVVSVVWVKKCRTVTYPSGMRGLHGKVKVSAPGFRMVILPVSVDAYGTWIGR